MRKENVHKYKIINRMWQLDGYYRSSSLSRLCAIEVRAVLEFPSCYVTTISLCDYGYFLSGKTLESVQCEVQWLPKIYMIISDETTFLI